jgi:tetratricopeptide (TPR) repeat protein
MNQDLLARLTAAKNDEERTWIITENLLNSLPKNLASLTWAAAIPHWFTPDILAALRPELKRQILELYSELLKLSFVEVFPERGYNIHELTRKLMLENLWKNNQDEFISLSARAVDYFANDNKAEEQIESLYHLVVVDFANQGKEQLNNLAQAWKKNFRHAEMEYLMNALLEKVESNRVTIEAKAEIYYLAGNTKYSVYKNIAALSYYEKALALFHEIGDSVGEANTLIAQGDVLHFRKQNDEAMKRYEQALEIYRKIDDPLGEANTLKAKGDILLRKQSDEAMKRYEQALEIYRKIDDPLGEANILKAKGDVLHFLNHNDAAKQHYEQALKFYSKIDDPLGEANTLIGLGDVLHSLERNDEAMQCYEQALEFYSKINDPLGEANTLYSQGIILKFLQQNNEAIQLYEQALELYEQIDHPLGKANTLYAKGDILNSLERNDEAMQLYKQALELYEQIDDPLGKANLQQAISQLQYNLM